MEQPKKTNIAKNLLFVVIMLAVVLIVVFSLNDISLILEAVKTANGRLILLAVLVYLGYVITTNLALHFVTTGLGIKLPFLDSMAIGSAEYFFNGITPFSSGGQPFQAYFYVKKGVSGDNAMSILMSNFIVYQVIMTVMSTLGLILFYRDIKDVLNQYMFLILIGYVANMSVLAILISISTIPGISKVFEWLFRTVGKIKFLTKSMQKLENRTFDFVKEFQIGMGLLFKRKRVLIGASLLRVLGLSLLHSVPYVIFLALGVSLDMSDLIFVISMSLFSTTFMMWVPTPGASGGTEWAFTVIFTSLVSGATTILVTSMLIWRFVTYYLGMLIGFIAYIVLRKRGI